MACINEQASMISIVLFGLYCLNIFSALPCLPKIIQSTTRFPTMAPVIIRPNTIVHAMSDPSDIWNASRAVLWSLLFSVASVVVDTKTLMLSDVIAGNSISVVVIVNKSTSNDMLIGTSAYHALNIFIQACHMICCKTFIFTEFNLTLSGWFLFSVACFVIFKHIFVI